MYLKYNKFKTNQGILDERVELRGPLTPLLEGGDDIGSLSHHDEHGHRVLIVEWWLHFRAFDSSDTWWGSGSQLAFYTILLRY